jgi:hypothetical protein
MGSRICAAALLCVRDDGPDYDHQLAGRALNAAALGDPRLIADRRR